MVGGHGRWSISCSSAGPTSPGRSITAVTCSWSCTAGPAAGAGPRAPVPACARTARGREIVAAYGRDGFRLTVTAWRVTTSTPPSSASPGRRPSTTASSARRRRGWDEHAGRCRGVACASRRPMTLDSALVELGRRPTRRRLRLGERPALSAIPARAEAQHRAAAGFRVQLVRLRGSTLDVALLSRRGPTGRRRRSISTTGRGAGPAAVGRLRAPTCGRTETSTASPRSKGPSPIEASTSSSRRSEHRRPAVLRARELRGAGAAADQPPGGGACRPRRAARARDRPPARAGLPRDARVRGPARGRRSAPGLLQHAAAPTVAGGVAGHRRVGPETPGRAGRSRAAALAQRERGSTTGWRPSSGRRMSRRGWRSATPAPTATCGWPAAPAPASTASARSGAARLSPARPTPRFPPQR